jgi:hypothetical protein
VENKYYKEEEGVIAFLSWWSNVGSIAEVTQEMKDALFPTISQIPGRILGGFWGDFPRLIFWG